MTVRARVEGTSSTGIVVGGGGPVLGQEYFRIYDQNNVLWTWWISYDLAADWALTPEKTFDKEVKAHIIPWWVKLVDSGGTLWYLYPDNTGAPLTSTSKPSVGNGLDSSPKLRVRGGTAKYQYAIVGGDVDVIPA